MCDFMDYIGSIIFGIFSIGKHKANTNELHPKVRKTCSYLEMLLLHQNKIFENSYYQEGQVDK